MLHLYYHGGSANHGCEAIVRSTSKLVKQPLTLWSTAIEEDREYGLDEVAALRSDTYIPVHKGSVRYMMCALEHKLLGSDYGFIRAGHEAFLNEVHHGDVCMSIGGDNYCYSGVENLGYYNRMLQEKGAKTVLWCCSVEPSVLTSSVVEDLKRYDLITVRESMSYEGLLNAGVKDNVVLCVDPAFHLDWEEPALPDGFTRENTIGINVSPLVAQCGNLVMENYIELVRHVLSESDDCILLIPHVVKKGTDDRQTLQLLLDQFPHNNRIKLVDDCNCQKLKGYISQCRLFVGARTHATIAAYSTGVPTLVSGYSIKARGIAKDLFGTDENYVLPVQKMKTVNDLKEAYCWLNDHSNDIRSRLVSVMPEYKKRVLQAVSALEKLG